MGLLYDAGRGCGMLFGTGARVASAAACARAKDTPGDVSPMLLEGADEYGATARGSKELSVGRGALIHGAVVRCSSRFRKARWRMKKMSGRMSMRGDGDATRSCWINGDAMVKELDVPRQETIGGAGEAAKERKWRMVGRVGLQWIVVVVGRAESRRCNSVNSVSVWYGYKLGDSYRSVKVNGLFCSREERRGQLEGKTFCANRQQAGVADLRAL
ncbi:hypothetical protein B0H13DRAFT_2409643 [Mycena leptocephala]|nr:hypothetical protein B0H13DRAFT_2409643 [Mycena leptocephala]